ncbi:hypothetical protein [Serratia sp. Se-RSmG]|uniref:hypothetical protein n=1 Tax=Serratia sp. Se-RSmG TaxID=3043307 RepID=UPI0024AFEA07|nr:hypothetical protein [Serratia sp. Se-RSmG]MDI6949523.1 hypothetical protein [Serratia sp. Se-RSmG]
MLLFMTKKQKETIAAIRNQPSLKSTGGAFSLESEVVKENMRNRPNIKDERSFMEVLIRKNQKEEAHNHSWIPSFFKRGESSSKESDTPSLNDMYVSGE